ncbi:hypothetical protein [Ignicoccus hospitalis]|uniref:Uncharacterized protein n=1 Tax=Ignicoccus hospitalis (strain KIN4/I / DSM 18386 / JCM 14125) TaxID=453591 RepID=A8ABN9_IGNH4|nr:hypothetical protein [Ignicoccus hospitalis]ABU82341.1 hypothetical protein Igni_1164 [Ignicoccus hospitalis KIN4/I]HIH89721.1 hypothetical protein [Desulfurococcaceae archaeon]
MRASYKAGQCGARVLVIKDLGIETPVANARELCGELKCCEAKDECEAALKVLSGCDVVIGPERVERALRYARALIPIGRFFQYADFVCRTTSRGLEMLRRLKLECPDYSYPRALFVADSLSPSVHFLMESLRRAREVGEGEVEAGCGLKVPEGLEGAYPFSQIECPQPLPKDLAEKLKDYM